MQKYHYTDGTNTFGPFSIEELQSKGITADTYVWTEGMPTWVLARQVPELTSLLFSEGQPYYTNAGQAPPQFPQTPPSAFGQNLQYPPKNYLIETILTTIFCCWPLGIPSIIYASRVEKRFYAGDLQGAEEASAQAKKWMWINVGACIGLWLLYFIIFGIGMFGAIMSGSSDF
ncbi:CD225/dispanin family protein [Sphingobacterium sp. LRF_L2]|uniref:CD225/dispanin family protein n=1 Tax=Sphingobacterium sp. LRF_L2 TaxID=3369421 RepID=UPI003F5ED707